jgi:ferrous iron transport protein A
LLFGQAWLRRDKETDLSANDSGVLCSTLDQVAIGDALAVLRVDAPAQSPEWGRWLEEIGFVAGEPVRLMAKAIPGGDPMVVRVGQSTFALRRVEAACVSVMPIEAFAASSLEQVVMEGAGA